MSERVRADCFLQAYFVGKFFDKMKDHDTGDVLAEPADKDIIFEGRFYLHLAAFNEIVIYLGDCPLGNRYKPLFASLSFHFDEPLAKV